MSRARLLRAAAAQLSRVCTGASGTAAAGCPPCLAGLQQGCLPSLQSAEHVTTRPYWAAAAAATVRTQATPLGMPASTAAAAAGRRHETTPAAQQCLLDRTLLIDTLDTLKRLEGVGLPREQAEALTRFLATTLCTNHEKMEELYVAKVTLEKSILEQEARHAGFRSEVLKSQELQVATFTRDTERLQINLEKIRSEIRYEIDKLTASQRLDLNLEKGRMRDELQMLRDKSNELEIKMDKEVNSLKAAMEQSKNDTVKYVLGLMLALLTAGLGAARLLMH